MRHWITTEVINKLTKARERGAFAADFEYLFGYAHTFSNAAEAYDAMMDLVRWVADHEDQYFMTHCVMTYEILPIYQRHFDDKHAMLWNLQHDEFERVITERGNEFSTQLMSLVRSLQQKKAAADRTAMMVI